jgi:hypothetical protein
MSQKDGENQPIDMVPVSCIELFEVDGRKKVEGESWETNDHCNQELIPDPKAILDPPQLGRQYWTTDGEEPQHNSIDGIKLLINNGNTKIQAKLAI